MGPETKPISEMYTELVADYLENCQAFNVKNWDKIALI